MPARRSACARVPVRSERTSIVERGVRYHCGIIRGVAMTLRLSDEDSAALRDLAAAQGRSMQELAQAAVREYVTAHSVDALVTSSIEGTLPAYRTLFERLGSV